MKVFSLLLSLSIWASSSYATDDFSAIDKYVNAAKKEIGLPSGTAVAVVKNGKIIYEGYFGYANIKANKKVTAETAFYIASITKPIFALSTLLMEHNGDIKDSTSMAEMFPKQDFPQFDADTVQLKHLMSCSSGIENDVLLNTLAFTGNHNVKQRHTLLSASVKNERNPLSQFEYTNLGFNIASVWVDDFYQQDWQKTLSETIYQPLGMNHTSSYMSDTVNKDIEIARPYGLRGKDPKDILSFEKNDITMHAGGGTIATASDLGLFLIAQLNQGKVNGQQVFPAQVIKKSQKQLVSHNATVLGFKRTGYAWGWQIGPYKGKKMLHHFGGVAGTHTHSSFMPDHNVGLVVLNNENYISQDLTKAIADIAYSILLNDGDASKKADNHILAMRSIASKMKVDIKKWDDIKIKKASSRVMELSLQQQKYAGLYHNPLWGDLTVTMLESGDFEIKLGEVAAVATAFTRLDTMRIEFTAMGEGGKVVSYKIKDDEVKGLSLFGKIFSKIG
jgi:CubicO group peptidase (beta-lactamase class C family)